jgi:hypothetical protein
MCITVRPTVQHDKHVLLRLLVIRSLVVICRRRCRRRPYNRHYSRLLTLRLPVLVPPRPLCPSTPHSSSPSLSLSLSLLLHFLVFTQLGRRRRRRPILFSSAFNPLFGFTAAFLLLPPLTNRTKAYALRTHSTSSLVPVYLLSLSLYLPLLCLPTSNQLPVALHFVSTLSLLFSQFATLKTSVSVMHPLPPPRPPPRPAPLLLAPPLPRRRPPPPLPRPSSSSYCKYQKRGKERRLSRPSSASGRDLDPTSMYWGAFNRSQLTLLFAPLSFSPLPA